MEKRNYKKGVAVAGLAALAAGVLYRMWDNDTLEVTELEMKREAIPKGFHGFRILQVSDLHDKSFGKEQEILLGKIRQLQPDIIIITGDLIDATPMKNAVCFARQAVGIAPVYYVAGNHECRYNIYSLLRKKLIAAGVFVLDNEVAALEKNGDKISLAGIRDPRFFGRDNNILARFDEMLSHLAGQIDTPFSILLSHRPEKFDLYAKYPYDLVFSGHAHGGQVRFPGIRGLYSPQQGIFPQYTGGMYFRNGTALVVSRGLGTTRKMPRIGNRPELVLLTLVSTVKD